MVKQQPFPQVAVLVCCLLAVYPGHAAPAEFTPYIRAGINYNDNLFFLSDEEEAVFDAENGRSSDTVLDIVPGMYGNWEYRRQLFSMDLSLVRKQYDHFDSLNFTGGDALLRWDWLYGPNWDGILTYRYIRRQSDFRNEAPLLGDIDTINRVFFRGLRKISPRYSIITGAGYNDKEEKIRDRLNREEYNLVGGMRYLSRADNFVDVVIRYSDGNYPDRDADDLAVGLDTGYEDIELLTSVYWELTGKSTLNLELGYLDRSQDTFSENDFDGIVGEVEYEWRATEKTELTGRIWRDLQDSEQVLANYSENTGISLEINWFATRKIMASALVSQVDRDYQEASDVPAGMQQDDDTFESTFGLYYYPRESFTIGTEYHYETRDSNLDRRDYTDNLYNLFVEYEF